jgi:hypothetical protein
MRRRSVPDPCAKNRLKAGADGQIAMFTAECRIDELQRGLGFGDALSQLVVLALENRIALGGGGCGQYHADVIEAHAGIFGLQDRRHPVAVGQAVDPMPRRRAVRRQ